MKVVIMFLGNIGVIFYIEIILYNCYLNRLKENWMCVNGDKYVVVIWYYVI